MAFLLDLFSKTTWRLLPFSMVYHPDFKLFCSFCPYLPVSDVAFSEFLWQHLSQMKLVFGLCCLIMLPAVSPPRDSDAPSCCCAFGSSTALSVLLTSSLLSFSRQEHVEWPPSLEEECWNNCIFYFWTLLNQNLICSSKYKTASVLWFIHFIRQHNHFQLCL